MGEGYNWSCTHVEGQQIFDENIGPSEYFSRKIYKITDTLACLYVRLSVITTLQPYYYHLLLL